MVFWKTYPTLKYLEGIFSNSPFISLQFTKNTIQTPENAGLEIYTESDINRTLLKKVLHDVQGFLKSYFGNPPKTPILDIPIKQLLGNKDHILLVRDIQNNQIIGCIRYKYIGKLLITDLKSELNPEIYCEDCFCIHPEWRKKGIGDYLLTSLHSYVNKNNIPYSLFLKEGKSLGVIHKPLYSGKYVYTYTHKHETDKYLGKLFTITVEQAYKLITILEECNINKSLVITNTNNINQYWLLYSKDNHKILISYQDTYQTTTQKLFREIEKQETEKQETYKLGWITAWFETPLITLNIKQDAINMFLEVISKKFDYVWANSQWIPSTCNWKSDGYFHWYTYQWTTNLNLKKNYCITI